MSVQFSNSSDENFVIRGTTKSCSLQRLDHYKAGSDSGYLRAHTLLTDRDQADITAAAMDTQTKFHLGVIDYWNLMFQISWLGSGVQGQGVRNLNISKPRTITTTTRALPTTKPPTK